MSLSSLSREGLKTSWGNRRASHLEGKEFVEIVTRDGVRNLLVPRTKPNLVTRFVSERELNRLKSCAKIQTVEDKMQDLKRKQDFDEKMKNESERRKQNLREIDLEKDMRTEDTKEASTADESDNVKLLSRAFLHKQEEVSENDRRYSINSILSIFCYFFYRRHDYMNYSGRRSKESKSNNSCSGEYLYSIYNR